MELRKDPITQSWVILGQREALGDAPEECPLEPAKIEKLRSILTCGSGCGSTRTCHAPSAGHVRMERSFSILAGSRGHSSGASPSASLCPRMTQLCVMGSLRSSIRYLQRV